MPKKFEKVPKTGITAEEVLTLWQKGKLYAEVDEVSKEELLARCQQEALEYVKPIDGYATEEWLPYINKVWENVVKEPSISSHLVLRRKQRLNRYFLTSLVYNLQALGLYRPVEEVSQLKLHLAMEQTERKNSVYKSAATYGVSGPQRKSLRLIMDKYKRV